MGEVLGLFVVLVIILGLPALLVWIMVWAIRLQFKINALRRGNVIGNTRLDDQARRWHERQLKYQAKLDATRGHPRSQPEVGKVDPRAPDRSAAELDALRFAARAAMVRRERERQRTDKAPPKAPKPRAERRRAWRNAPGAPNQRRGRSARFTYADEDGVVTDRQIQNWTIASNYIEGWCIDRKEMRTFRLDRVEEWHGWS